MKTYKFRLYPRKSQKTNINGQLELCRNLYNRSLELKIKTYEKDKTNLSLYDLNKILTIWKQEDIILKTVYAQSLQKVNERLDNAFKGFYRRIKLGQAGFPRFKAFGRYRSIEYTQSGYKILSNEIIFSKIGRIKAKIHRIIQGKIKLVTIIKYNTGKYFVSIVTDHVDYTPNKKNKPVGVDLGIKTLLTCSDGFKIENPKFLTKCENSLKRLHSRYSKNKSKKNRRSLNLAYEKLTNKREDFLHKTSNLLIKKYGKFCFEKLNIKAMKSYSPINKSVYDSCWNKLILKLSYKALNAGKTVILVDPIYTSKQCSRCGNINLNFTLDQKVYKCHCGLSMNRDSNAAINIMRRGLASS